MAVDAVVKQAVDLTIQQTVDQLQLALTVVARVAEQHHVTMIQRGLQQNVRHRGDKSIADIRHDQSSNLSEHRASQILHC